MDNQQTKIGPGNNTPVTSIPPVIDEPIEPTLPKNEYQDVLNKYAASTPAAEPQLPPIVPQETEPTLETSETPEIPETEVVPPTLADFGITQKPTGSNFPKIIFILSLIIFILVATSFAFVYFKNKMVSTTTTVEITPTSIVTGSCYLNENTYKVGESFASADGCNTCTCESQNNISCTEKECLAPATTITPTATSSSTAL